MQHDEFFHHDQVEFHSLSISKLKWHFDLFLSHEYDVDYYQLIQSSELLDETCIPKFSLKIFSDLKYEAFHNGVECSVKSYTHF